MPEIWIAELLDLPEPWTAGLPRTCQNPGLPDSWICYAGLLDRRTPGPAGLLNLPDSWTILKSWTAGLLDLPDSWNCRTHGHSRILDCRIPGRAKQNPGPAGLLNMPESWTAGLLDMQDSWT